ncbi:hypothetical protein OpiT1DRAFT_01322 [Opitutaceae bacterium TAV1]|nr:hypothetical protein OpiT1DRAFT_01322 [Opitutaceae bacterium TAV1]
MNIRALTLLSAFSLSVSSFPASPAFAAEARSPSESLTINLVHLLVQQGVITRAQADGLIAQAEAETAEARRAAAPAAAATAPTGDADDTKRVIYVPEVVKQQLREDIKQEVMKQARDENWAAPRAIPEWTQRFRLSGDLRFRYEGDFFPSGNAADGSFPDFNAINRGSPYDVSDSNPDYPPQLNADQDRERLRLRARLALDADLGESFTAGLRLATGNDSSPVSTNQSMGADGLGSKYALWLDRAFLTWEAPFHSPDATRPPDTQLAFTVGRFANPFFSTDLIWDDDLGFDGIMGQVSRRIGRITPFAVAGLFPVYNTDFNFSTNQPEKFKSDDKWLYGAQLGADWKITDAIKLKLAVAYYDFASIEGRLSSPYIPLSSSDAGDTDSTRPAFAQKGNTYMELRNIIPSLENNNGTINQWQYYGLATPFRELAFTGRLDFTHFDPVHVSLEIEAVKNLAYDEAAIDAKAVNNRVPSAPGDPAGSFDGGDFGWFARLNVGNPVLERFGDWQASIAYKYVESDAVVDAFTDSDFGLGGTNLKGYILGLSMGLSKRVNGRIRWLSADSIGGAAYSVDVFQFDINARF